MALTSSRPGGEPPLGDPVDFTPARRPSPSELVGAYVTLAPVDPGADAPELYRISHAPDGDPSLWTYLPYGPFPDAGSYASALELDAGSDDPQFFTVAVAGRPRGIVSYLAIVPEHGTIELGHIWFGPGLARTPAATEAIYLLARHAFDELGYRRVEWRCNALNAASRRAAQRFGFVYEGTLAQHRVVKGHNRDTAWFAITDGRWPQLRRAFEAWLSPDNFDRDGRQRRPLSQFRAPPTDEETTVPDWNDQVIAEFRANAGKVGGMFEGMPLILVHHVGAKSGTARVAPLVYLPDGDRYVIFASKGGAPENPGWYHNLLANPETEAEVGTATVPVRAVEVTGAERDRLYAAQMAVAPQFAEYQEKTSRTIPVIVLEPR